MLNFIVEVIIWCLCIYGLFSLIKDIMGEYTYKKIQKNIKLILTVKNVEDGIENYIRELKLSNNFFNNLVVIDLESKDKTVEILEELQKESINLKILNKEQGLEYIEKALTPVE